jgi:DNA polymerase-1
MQSPDILLFDANSIDYAAMFVPDLAKMNVDGLCTAALHGLPASVFRIMRLFPEATPVLLWDGNAQWRSELYPDYKANRLADPATVQIKEAYKAQGKHLRQLFLRLGLPQIAEPSTEADDVAGLITRNAPADLQILMVSTDSDYVQALAPNISLLNPRTDTLIDLTHIATPDFKDGPFSSPEQYLIAKCLAGDTSDFICGLDNIGLKTGVKILEQHGSLEALWQKADNGATFKSKRIQTIVSTQGREIYLRNRKLMDWRQAIVPDDIKVYGAAADPQAFVDITRQFKLPSGSLGLNFIERSHALGRYERWHQHGRLLRQIMNERIVDRPREPCAQPIKPASRFAFGVR